eukprot:3487406-Pyramimonas_sp.AAC.1
MFEVAEEVKRIVNTKVADNTEYEHYRAMQALRAWRAGDSIKLGMAIAARPALAQRFPAGLQGARCDALCHRAQILHNSL